MDSVQQDQTLDQIQEDKKVKWGGLAKNIAAGTAIIAGAILVVPGLAPALQEGLKGLGTNLGDVAGNIKNLDFSAIIKSIADAFNKPHTGAVSSGSESIGSLLRITIGAAMAYFGSKHVYKNHKAKQEAASQPVELPQGMQDGFAMQHELRKAQTIMKSQMAMTGYQPAMAGGPAV